MKKRTSEPIYTNEREDRKIYLKNKFDGILKERGLKPKSQDELEDAIEEIRQNPMTQLETDLVQNYYGNMKDKDKFISDFAETKNIPLFAKDDVRSKVFEGEKNFIKVSETFFKSKETIIAKDLKNRNIEIRIEQYLRKGKITTRYRNANTGKFYKYEG